MIAPGVTVELVADTFRESFSRKIFWGFFGCSTVLMLLFLLVLNIDIVEGGVAAIKIFGHDVNNGQGVEVAQVVDGVLGGVAVFLFTAGLFFSVFASAGLIPTVFEAGRIELLLSKPLGRSHLLLGKVLGRVGGDRLEPFLLGARRVGDPRLQDRHLEGGFLGLGGTGDFRLCCIADNRAVCRGGVGKARYWRAWRHISSCC